MSQQERTSARFSASAAPASSDGWPNRAADGGEAVAPIRNVVSHWVLEALVGAYGGDTHRLLTELAPLLEASLAYVDRATVEAHLERPLSDREWAAIAAEFTAMAFAQRALRHDAW